jgi:hypothetical protein
MTLEGGKWGGSDSVGIKTPNYGTYVVAKHEVSFSILGKDIGGLGVLSVYVTVLSQALNLGKNFISIKSILEPGEIRIVT